MDNLLKSLIFRRLSQVIFLWSDYVINTNPMDSWLWLCTSPIPYAWECLERHLGKYSDCPNPVLVWSAVCSEGNLGWSPMLDPMGWQSGNLLTLYQPNTQLGLSTEGFRIHGESPTNIVPIYGLLALAVYQTKQIFRRWSWAICKE